MTALLLRASAGGGVPGRGHLGHGGRASRGKGLSRSKRNKEYGGSSRVTPGRVARDKPHATAVIGRTQPRVGGYAVIVSLYPLALSEAASPARSADFM